LLLNSIASPADVFEIFRAERIGVTSLTNSGSRDVIGHVIPHRQFPIGVFWNQAPITNGFRDIQCRMWRNSWHNLDTTSKQRSRSFILV